MPGHLRPGPYGARLAQDPGPGGRCGVVEGPRPRSGSGGGPVSRLGPAGTALRGEEDGGDVTGSAVRRLFGAACILAAFLGVVAASTQAGEAGAASGGGGGGAGGARVAMRLAPGLSAPEHAALERAGAYGAHPVRLLIVGDSIALTLGMGLSVDAQDALRRHGGRPGDRRVRPRPATRGAHPGVPRARHAGLRRLAGPLALPGGGAAPPGRGARAGPLGGHGPPAPRAVGPHRRAPPGMRISTADLGSAIAILHTFGAKVVLFTMPYVDPSDRQPDGLPWPENTPAPRAGLQRPRAAGGAVRIRASSA